MLSVSEMCGLKITYSLSFSLVSCFLEFFRTLKVKTTCRSILVRKFEILNQLQTIQADAVYI